MLVESLNSTFRHQFFLLFFPAMRNTRTYARTDVQAQGVRPQSARLSQDDAVSEVAEDGCPAG